MNSSFKKVLKISTAALFVASSTFAIADGEGKKTYDAACGVCHAAGIAGAPKFADKEAWAPRIATGKDALYKTALTGKGAMPAKGGQTQLSDDVVKAAVDYMVSNAK